MAKIKVIKPQTVKYATPDTFIKPIIVDPSHVVMAWIAEMVENKQKAREQDVHVLYDLSEGRYGRPKPVKEDQLP